MTSPPLTAAALLLPVQIELRSAQYGDAFTLVLERERLAALQTILVLVLHRQHDRHRLVDGTTYRNVKVQYFNPHDTTHSKESKQFLYSNRLLFPSSNEFLALADTRKVIYSIIKRQIKSSLPALVVAKSGKPGQALTLSTFVTNVCWIDFTWSLRQQAAYKQATRGPTALSPFRGTRQ